MVHILESLQGTGWITALCSPLDKLQLRIVIVTQVRPQGVFYLLSFLQRNKSFKFNLEFSAGFLEHTHIFTAHPQAFTWKQTNT